MFDSFFSVIRVLYTFVHILFLILASHIYKVAATAAAAAEFRSRPPTATRPLRSSRPLPTPRAQQQHQHDQYTSAAAPRFAATAAAAAAATTLLATPNRAAALRPRSEVRSLYIPRRVRTPAARRFVSGGRSNDRRLVAIQHIFDTISLTYEYDIFVFLPTITLVHCSYRHGLLLLLLYYYYSRFTALTRRRPPWSICTSKVTSAM